MKTHIQVVKYRRKQSGKTDYRTRLNLLSGHKQRIVVRKSLKFITIQIVEYSPTGDTTLVFASSKELVKLGWKFGTKNTAASYLCGLLLGKKAVKAKITHGVVDLGRYTTNKGNKLFAAVKGLIDAGMKISINKDVLPSDERISGAHIAAGAKSVKSPHQFANLKKQNINVADIQKNFTQVKESILR